MYVVSVAWGVSVLSNVSAVCYCGAVIFRCSHMHITYRIACAGNQTTRVCGTSCTSTSIFWGHIEEALKHMAAFLDAFLLLYQAWFSRCNTRELYGQYIVLSDVMMKRCERKVAPW